MRYPIHACALHWHSAVRVLDKRCLESHPKASVAPRVARLTSGWHPRERSCDALYDRIRPSHLDVALQKMAWYRGNTCQLCGVGIKPLLLGKERKHRTQVA